MPVLSEFSPQGAPGQTGRAAMDARDHAESWMDRAQSREASKQNMEAQRQQMALNAILLPVKEAQSKADLVKAKTDLDVATNLQGFRKQAFGMYDDAVSDLNHINMIPDMSVRARMSGEWTSRYAQLRLIEELKPQMEALFNNATKNREDFLKQSILGGAEARAFEQYTQGFSPEEKAKAQRVKTGLTGRASGAAIQYKEVVGPDGSKRLVAVDPREVGAQVVDSGESFGSGVNETAASTGQKPGSNTLTGQSTREETLAKETAKNEAEYQQKLKTEKPKRSSSIKQAGRLTEQLSSDIDDLIGKVSAATAGPGGVILDKFPGTTARDLQANLDSIKANIGFQTLQSMREASPTGGALGQVSDAENKLLQARFGALEIGQSPAQLIQNLKKVKSRIVENYGITRSAYEQQYGEEADAEQPTNWDESKEKRLQELKAKLGK